MEKRGKTCQQYVDGRKKKKEFAGAIQPECLSHRVFETEFPQKEAFFQMLSQKLRKTGKNGTDEKRTKRENLSSKFKNIHIKSYAPFLFEPEAL